MNKIFDIVLLNNLFLFWTYLFFNWIKEFPLKELLLIIRPLFVHIIHKIHYSYVTHMYSISFVDHSHILVCYFYVTPMYLYFIRLSLICTRIPFVCHSYVFVFTLISLVSTRISRVCIFVMIPPVRADTVSFIVKVFKRQ